MTNALNDFKLVEFHRNLVSDCEIPLSIKLRMSKLFLKEFWGFDRTTAETYEEKVKIITNNVIEFVNYCKSGKVDIDANDIVFLANILLSTSCCSVCENQVDFYVKNDTGFIISSLIAALKFQDIHKFIYELGFIQGMEALLQIS